MRPPSAACSAAPSVAELVEVAGAVFCVDILLLYEGRRTLSRGPAELQKPATGHAATILSRRLCPPWEQPARRDRVLPLLSCEKSGR